MLMHSKCLTECIGMQGAKGQLSIPIPAIVEIRQAEDTLRVFKTEESRNANCMHGLIR